MESKLTGVTNHHTFTIVPRESPNHRQGGKGEGRKEKKKEREEMKKRKEGKGDKREEGRKKEKAVSFRTGRQVFQCGSSLPASCDLDSLYCL